MHHAAFERLDYLGAPVGTILPAAATGANTLALAGTGDIANIRESGDALTTSVARSR
jgi:hypothetical protein